MTGAPLTELTPLLDAIRTAPALDFTQPVTELRVAADAGVMALRPYVRDVPALDRIDDYLVPVEGGTVPVRVYRPAGDGRLPLHIHLHGGGWWMGGLDTADPMARELAYASGLAIVSVGYRLAPEHRWPTAAEDAYAALRWVTENADALTVDSESISIGGESAGGNIAAVVALMARDRGGPPLVAQWLDVPGVDLTLPDSPSLAQFGTGFGLDVAGIVKCVEWYVDAEQRSHPYVSPARATDLSGLPPAIVTTCECDPLRDQGEAYAERLAAVGVPVIAIRAAGQLHATTWLTALSASAADWHAEAVGALVGLHTAGDRSRNRMPESMTQKGS